MFVLMDYVPWILLILFLLLIGIFDSFKEKNQEVDKNN